MKKQGRAGAFQVDLVAVGPKRYVVAEPARQLVRVCAAPDPRKQSDVESRLTLGRVQPVRAHRDAGRAGRRRITCSIGCPSPRSVASEIAASSSARRIPARVPAALTPASL